MKKATIYLQTIIMFMMVAFSLPSFSVEPDSVQTYTYEFVRKTLSSGNYFCYGTTTGGETPRGDIWTSSSYPASAKAQCPDMQIPLTSYNNGSQVHWYYNRQPLSFTCPSNSTASGRSCSCNTGYAESNNQCQVDANNNGIPDDDEQNCETDKKRLRFDYENPIVLNTCSNGCSYNFDNDDPEPVDCYTHPNSSTPNQVYCSFPFTGTGQACTSSANDPTDEDAPIELDCPSVGMVNNATNDGCISPESPACPENYVDTLTEDGCQPMTCPVCTFWSEVGGNNGGGGCIQNDACKDPILDNDNDGIPNKTDPDIDGDGVPNGSDPDVDGDGIPNGRDNDIDGDGVPNGNDNDMNGNGQSNSVDSDRDGDGIPNEEDEQDGAGDGTGDCDGEPEKCELLTNISDALTGDGVDGEVLLQDLNQSGQDMLDDYQDQAGEAINGFLTSDLWASDFLGAISDAPNPFDYLGNKAGSCSYPIAFPSGTQYLNICPYIDHIHAALAFGLFVLLAFGIRDLILEKETT